MSGTWIKCGDQLPKPGEIVLAWDRGAGCQILARYNEYTYRVEAGWRAELGCYCLEYHEYEITHWMPKPDPPKENQAMPKMRAKLQVGFVQESFYGPDKSKSSETLTMHAVCAPKYDALGLDEDNTFAKFTPSALLSLNIANPALWGTFVPGEQYYVDFTRVKQPPTSGTEV